MVVFATQVNPSLIVDRTPAVSSESTIIIILWVNYYLRLKNGATDGWF